MIEDLWYKNAVMYSLDLETFLDGNDDGTGDFQGLNEKLDYLHALGVDTIWLAPFQPTPNKDNGYDVKDYYGVDPRHGSSGDFVQFMHHAKKRGLKVIIDLVVNHTSDQHPWFQDARKGKDAKHHDWYIWSDTRPPNYDEGMVFPGVQKAIWTKDEKAKAYYFHRFYEFQPDLNMDNLEVREEVMRIMGYWLQLGVDGFRVDAVPFILETPPKGNNKPHLTFEYLSEMRRFLQWRKGDAILLGEANVLPTENKKYFGEEGDGIHLMFNFFVNQHLFYSLASGDVRPLIKALKATKDIHPMSQWAQFLRNHDELDLGRLTEKQRQVVFEKFGPEKRMQLYDRGIRRRLSPMLGNRPQSELAYSLVFSLPGTPVIRYGDEIGMGDDLSLKERDAVRTPMHWSNDFQGGFSKAKKLVHPVIDKGPYSFQHINVDDQRRQPDSLLNWLTALIRLRKECPEIGWGEWEIIDTENWQILCMLYNWEGRSLYVIHNFDSEPHEIHLKRKPNGQTLKDLMVKTECPADKKGVHKITLEAYGYKWLRVDGKAKE
ncbi:MAG: alpha-glucosidase C-terminal domain-containing protein [Chitinophagaceae bacterium]|jgi:maltose alpha-D-glucosyltransferase/alpha-amylase|nr:alpha-glucosidase C-terminal domain-containing protein [Chitinophagaceae bacterium]